MIMCLPRVGSQRSPRISADVMRSVALWRRVPDCQSSDAAQEFVFIAYNTPKLFFFPPAWILMRPHADKSNMSSAVLMYTRVSESSCPGCPVWTPQNLIYDWQLIWKSQNTPAWPSERDSVDKKQLSPDSSPSRQSGPVAQRLSASIRFLPPPLPQKTH